MKQAIILSLLLAQLSMAQGQTNPGAVFYTNKEMRYFFYLEQRGPMVTLSRMGKYMDKAGIGPSILYTDTLAQSPIGNEWLWTSPKVKIKQTDGQLTLHFWDDRQGKAKAIQLYPVADTQQVHTTLNHAYWLDHFFAMSKTINNAFPFYHYSFREGFGRWESLDNKNLPYPIFRPYADAVIKTIQDSITKVHLPYTATANAIINRINTIDYAALKDSVSALAHLDEYPNRYFSTIIKAIANNRPELYFPLADDLPNKKAAIFSAVYEKETIKKLKAIPTDSPAKRAFIEHKKSDRNSLLSSLAAGAAGAALMVYSIYALTR